MADDFATEQKTRIDEESCMTGCLSDAYT